MKKKVMSDQEFMVRAEEIRETCQKYGFLQRRVRPYAFWMTVEQLVNNHGWLHIEDYTYSSRVQIKRELEGFEEILRAWVEYAEAPKVRVQKAGIVEEFPQEIADALVEMARWTYAS